MPAASQRRTCLFRHGTATLPPKSEIGHLRVRALRPAQQPRSRVVRPLHAEGLAEPSPPLAREPQRAGVAHPCQPDPLEAAAADLGADVAGDVIAPLAPVEAGPAIDAALIGLRRERGAEARQKPRAAIG